MMINIFIGLLTLFNIEFIFYIKNLMDNDERIYSIFQSFSCRYQ